MLETDRVPDFELASRQLLRAIRGKRSQVAFARRLGFRGNPIADWESGRRAPTADRALAACGLAGIDTVLAFARFHVAEPPELGSEGLAAWLRRVRGATTIHDLALRSGFSRHQVSRWLAGEARPKLSEFLRLVEAITGRISDLIAELVPIEQVPCLADLHARREAARRLAYDEPWTEAILRVLEIAEYRALPEHTSGFIADYLGIDPSIELRCLEKLLEAGVIRRVDRHFRNVGSLTVDTRSVSLLKAHWTERALDRVRDPGPDDLFSYNVFSASAADVVRIRELLRATFREIRALVSATEADERVALVNLQLLQWPPRARPGSKSGSSSST
jgi:transcriptional regulator with XRE-family HTH domain